ncbi:MAG: 50S ribosomal protein L29 [Planctomycetaceae bacterium]
MNKAREIREMADEQIRLVWKDAAESLFKLRLQAQTEKLKAPSDVKKLRRTIARCQTVLRQRGTLAPEVPTPAVRPAARRLVKTRVKGGRGRSGGDAKAKVASAAVARPRAQKRTQVQKRAPGG